MSPIHVVPGFQASPGASVVARPRQSPIAPLIVPADVYQPPIHLYAEAQVQAGGEQPLSSKALGNYTGHPIWIHEIRVQARVIRDSADPTLRLSVGGFLGLRLALGKIPITNGYVPVWTLGKTENSSEEDVNIPPISTHSHYVWRLPHPLWVPKGAEFIPRFRHYGLVRYPVDVHLGFAGRLAQGEAPPRNLKVPYTASWTSKTFDYGPADEETSPETALTNTTGKRIRIERLIERIGNWRDAGYGVVFSDQDHATTGAKHITARLSISNGHQVTTHYVPFRTIFNPVTGTLETPHELDPDEFYVASVRKEVGNANWISAYSFFREQVFIAMSGWREEALP